MIIDGSKWNYSTEKSRRDYEAKRNLLSSVNGS
jgi:hypothetical protein